MDLILFPRRLRGQLRAIPSKSQAHRLLICAALAQGDTELICPQTNADIEATARSLTALGADIRRTNDGYRITPVNSAPSTADLFVGESGSTLRFLLPVAGALGVDATFHLEGRLPQRPLSPLWEELERMGCRLSRPTANTVHICGRLRSGAYSVAGNVSSQFISGLLFAAAILRDCSVSITGKTESAPYIHMTRLALKQFGVDASGPSVCGVLRSPGRLTVEGDWSNAAFFLATQALGSSVTVQGLDPDSAQGDRAVTALLELLDDQVTIDAADIPDLVPILSVVAAANRGARFLNIQRLRTKESDRIASTEQMLHSLGVPCSSDEDSLTVFPAALRSGTVDTFCDHRIAMSAAIAATVADGPITVRDAQCVEKSYPSFWEEYRTLGGYYELCLR